MLCFLSSKNLTGDEFHTGCGVTGLELETPLSLRLHVPACCCPFEASVEQHNLPSQREIWMFNLALNERPG